ncbi:MAG: hypothetical protein AAF664_25815 [Planctomycetota bacterium]
MLETIEVRAYPHLDFGPGEYQPKNPSERAEVRSNALLARILLDRRSGKRTLTKVPEESFASSFGAGMLR